MDNAERRGHPLFFLYYIKGANRASSSLGLQINYPDDA